MYKEVEGDQQSLAKRSEAIEVWSFPRYDTVFLMFYCGEVE